MIFIGLTDSVESITSRYFKKAYFNLLIGAFVSFFVSFYGLRKFEPDIINAPIFVQILIYLVVTAIVLYVLWVVIYHLGYHWVDRYRVKLNDR